MFLNQRNIVNIPTLIIFGVSLVASGCVATRNMPITQDTAEINITKMGIAILSLKISNHHVPGYQPRVNRVGVTEVAQSAETSFEEIFFEVPWRWLESAEEQFNEYLLSFQFPSGKYQIGTVDSSWRQWNIPVPWHI